MHYQQNGHTKNNFTRPFRYVKCWRSHNIVDCPKNDRSEPAACALCLDNHPTNFKGCCVYREILKRKLKSKPEETESRSFHTPRWDDTGIYVVGMESCVRKTELSGTLECWSVRLHQPTLYPCSQEPPLGMTSENTGMHTSFHSHIS